MPVVKAVTMSSTTIRCADLLAQAFDRAPTALGRRHVTLGEEQVPPLIGDLAICTDMVGPALGRLTLGLHLVRPHVLVGLDLDDPPSASFVARNEVRVVLATLCPEDRQVAGLEPKPPGDIVAVVEQIRD